MSGPAKVHDGYHGVQAGEVAGIVGQQGQSVTGRGRGDLQVEPAWAGATAVLTNKSGQCAVVLGSFGVEGQNIEAVQDRLHTPSAV